MTFVFRPSTPDDLARIIDLLTRAFSVGPDAPSLDPLLLRWKFWDPRPDHGEPRSFVTECDGRIAAHVGLWPVTVRSGAAIERGVHMIDWASDPQVPGAGVSMLQRLIRSYDFVYSIGGSKATLSILPKLGFGISAQALTFARPIRPWRQVFQHQDRSLRLPLRLLRNIWWSEIPARGRTPEWRAVERAALGDQVPAALTRERCGAFFEYLEKCPAAHFQSFHILDRGRKSGFFSLAHTAGQARVAGVWLENPDVGYWRVAFQLAQEAALRYSETSEIIARTTSEASAIAASQAGMRLRAQAPVFLFRRTGGSSLLPLQFQMVDNDEVFLKTGFVT